MGHVPEPDVQLPARDLLRQRPVEPHERRILCALEPRVGVLRPGCARGHAAAVEIVEPVEGEELGVELDVEAEGRVHRRGL